MIGIYKITKKENGKSYIGQSNNIERRFSEHQTKGEKSRIPVDIAIKKYGKDAFLFEVIEECSIEQLNEREEYWIKFYDTKNNGYNCSNGGDQQSSGENNGRAKMTEQDIINIRIAYANHKRQRDTYEQYKYKTTFGNFQNIWQGRTWAHIMPEVFTKENREYYSLHNSDGQNSAQAKFSNEEIMQIRTRYITESAKSIHKDYKDKISLQGLQAILWGRTYKNLPIYKKNIKQWVNIESVSTIP